MHNCCSIVCLVRENSLYSSSDCCMWLINLLSNLSRWAKHGPQFGVYSFFFLTRFHWRQCGVWVCSWKAQFAAADQFSQSTGCWPKDHCRHSLVSPHWHGLFRCTNCSPASSKTWLSVHLESPPACCQERSWPGLNKVQVIPPLAAHLWFLF